MRDGRIEQVDAPLEIYRRPATLFVAGFVGSPAMNLLPGDLPGLPVPQRGGAVLGVRPHDVTIVDPAAGDLAAAVDVVEHRGNELLVRLRLESGDEMRVLAPASRAIAPDERVGVRLDRDRLHWFDRETGRRIEA
jgi:ABC-type sugar transport system ATPase subunit